jgi:hypothetical protein
MTIVVDVRASIAHWQGKTRNTTEVDVSPLLRALGRELEAQP